MLKQTALYTLISVSAAPVKEKGVPLVAALSALKPAAGESKKRPATSMGVVDGGVTAASEDGKPKKRKLFANKMSMAFLEQAKRSGDVC